MKIDNNELGRMREFICGLLTGISASGKMRSEVLKDDYWIHWSSDYAINLVEDDDGDTQIAVYECIDGQLDDSDWLTINLYGDYTNAM